MESLIVSVVIGFVLIVIGIFNVKGNISTLHRYHRKRVAPQDVKPFGRLVGIGTILIGVCIALFGILSFVAQTNCNNSLEIVASAIAIAGIIAGVILMIFAMIKYNKGIF